MFFSILIGILIFGVIIFVHELGHFLTARACGVGINEFAIGMGPKLVSHKGKDDILYSIRLFPIGGFVSMVGEDEEVEEQDKEKALNRKPVWKRFIVISAGAVMNLLSGFLVMSIIVATSGQLLSNKIERFRIAGDDGKAVSTYQGFQIGDEIVKIGNKKINVRSDLVYTAMRAGTKSIDVTVLRNGKKTVIPKVVFPPITEKGIVFGRSDFFVPEIKDKNVGAVIQESFCQSISTIDMIWNSFIDLLAGKYGTKALSGPVGVVGEIGETAKYGVSALAYLFVLISMNVGLFNLFPLPALDGGRLVFLLIELVRRKPIKPQYEGYVHLAGLALLLLLMVFVTFNDIVGLIKK